MGAERPITNFFYKKSTQTVTARKIIFSLIDTGLTNQVWIKGRLINTGLINEKRV